MITRAQIMQGLNSYLKTHPVIIAAGFKGFYRRYRSWDEVEASAKPALITFKSPEGEQYPARAILNQPPKRTLDAWGIIYATVNNQDPNFICEDVLNDLVDAVDTALKPPIGQAFQTLGGVAMHCWIEGHIVWATGDLDGKAAAKIPLKILIP